MSMKYLILSLLFLSVQWTVWAQLKQKTADAHFQRMEYYKAAPMYKELVNKLVKRNKGEEGNIRKAAISFAKLYRFREALQFEDLLRERLSSSLTEDDVVRYIHVLRITGNYPKADEQIKLAVSKFPTNTILRNWSQESELRPSLYADSAMNKVNCMPFNSNQGDFAPMWMDNKLVFASKSVNHGFLVPRYGWDNAYFINLMEVTQQGDSWSSPRLLKQTFFSRAHDGPVAFSPDGKEMLLTRNVTGKKKGKDVVHLALYFANRQSDGSWSALVPFAHNVSGFNTGHAAYTPDGNGVYFVSDREGGIGGTDLYFASRNGSGWSEPTLLPESINTTGDELFPSVGVDGQLFFASNGHPGLGGLDVYEVNPRASNPRPVNMGYPINSSQDDFGLIADSTANFGYFSSNRGDFVDRIYSWKRRPPVIKMEGRVYEIYTVHELVPNHPVKVFNAETGEQKEVLTDETGFYSLELTPNSDYMAMTNKEYFLLLHPELFDTREIKRDTTLIVDLYLNPTTIMVKLVVRDKETKLPIPQATLSVKEAFATEELVFNADDNGSGEIRVKRWESYWAHASKKGYIDAETGFETGSQTDKLVELELELPKIKKNETFKLDYIFYDLNKATLRPESMASLDKLADFILKNNLRIELSSHTNSRGSDSYNMKLSQQRAQSCVDYLISKGVPKANIVAKGYGETKLINRCKNNVPCDEEEHQENRRTEVKILELK
jgi:outer membrane protein OmpA-like peptidoglycan-associated protein